MSRPSVVARWKRRGQQLDAKINFLPLVVYINVYIYYIRVYKHIRTHTHIYSGELMALSCCSRGSYSTVRDDTLIKRHVASADV